MKNRKRLIWQLYPSYLIIIVIALVTLSWYFYGYLDQFYIEKTRQRLKIDCQLIEKQIKASILFSDSAVVDKQCKDIAGGSEIRITVILPDGRVVGDSEKNSAYMDNHKNRPEVLKALTGKTGLSVRFSGTMRQRMMYVAVPVMQSEHDNSIIAILRVSVLLSYINKELEPVKTKIIFAVIVAMLVAAVICFFVSRFISRPIEEMKKGAEKFAKGDFSSKLNIPDTFELAALSSAINRMALQLMDRIDTVKDQLNEHIAVLASMTEGVVAINNDEKILGINLAAADMFKLDSEKSKGQNLQEIIRNHELHKMVAEVSLKLKAVEQDISILNNGERFLNIRIMPLFNNNKKRMGILILLHDVTQIRNLENMRRDFVANVSHEIKTPLTAIKGFVETILYNRDMGKDEVERFLGIIVKHVDRLSLIVEDLLSLSTIEKVEENDELNFQNMAVKDVMESAVQVVNEGAKLKNIEIECICDSSIMAKLDPFLFEQALVNLLDNAVKYSQDGKKVLIDACITEKEIVISVKDNGYGISKKHLSHLFERFYRVDKARSRKLGGTGLGLAIVKHIAKAHGGYVAVDSALGRGSTFAVHIPEVCTADS